MLYLCSILTDDGLNDNTFLITCNEISNKLGIANLITFKGSLDYLLSVGYDYKLYSQSRWYSVDSIIVSYKQYRGHFEIIVNDEFINLLGKTRQFYQIPKLLLNSDIRYYKHSLFIANYILLHQRRNKGKKNENTISVKELLKNCPLMPLYNDLNPEQRQVKRAIICPFEKNLSFACYLMGIKWRYTDDEPTNYIDFIRAKISLDSNA